MTREVGWTGKCEMRISPIPSIHDAHKRASRQPRYCDWQVLDPISSTLPDHVCEPVRELSLRRWLVNESPSAASNYYPWNFHSLPVGLEAWQEEGDPNFRRLFRPVNCVPPSAHLGLVIPRTRWDGMGDLLALLVPDTEGFLVWKSFTVRLWLQEKISSERGGEAIAEALQRAERWYRTVLDGYRPRGRPMGSSVLVYSVRVAYPEAVASMRPPYNAARLTAQLERMMEDAPSESTVRRWLATRVLPPLPEN